MGVKTGCSCRNGTFTAVFCVALLHYVRFFCRIWQKTTFEHLQYFHTNPKSRRWLLNFHWNSRTSATTSHRQIYFHIHFDTPWQLHVLVLHLTHTWEWRSCAHSKLFQACARVRVGRWTVDQDQGCQVNAGIFLYTTTPNAFKHQYAKYTFKTIVTVDNWHFEIDYSPQKRLAYVILEWHFHRDVSSKYRQYVYK